MSVMHAMMMMHAMTVHVVVHVMVMHVAHARRWLSRRRVWIQRIPNEVMGVLVRIVGGHSNIGLGRKHSSKHCCNQKRGLTHRSPPWSAYDFYRLNKDTTRATGIDIRQSSEIDVCSRVRRVRYQRAAQARGGRRRSWNQARYFVILVRCAPGA